MTHKYFYEPFRFFSTTFMITWTTWFISAALSQTGDAPILRDLLMLIGLLGPFIAALILVLGSGDKKLKQDFKGKIFNLKRIKPIYLPIVFFLIPAVMILSILLSVFFGQSIEQLTLTSEFRIMEGAPLLSLLIPLFAPALEELGWSGYGIDSLKQRHTLFKTTLLFAVLWALWHLPLFFIHGYYHNGLYHSGMIYVINFFVSVIPLTFITNWLYFRNDRSVITAILFHVVTVMSAEMFLVTNTTKCIVTLVVTVAAFLIIFFDRSFFFKKG